MLQSSPLAATDSCLPPAFGMQYSLGPYKVTYKIEVVRCARWGVPRLGTGQVCKDQPTEVEETQTYGMCSFQGPFLGGAWTVSLEASREIQ